MKKLTVYCKFGEIGTFDKFDFYLSESNGRNPLFFQIWYLTNIRGGMLPQHILTIINELLKLSRESNVSFEELIAYAIRENNDSYVSLEKPDDKDKPKEIDPEVKFLFEDNENTTIFQISLTPTKMNIRKKW